MMLPLGIRNAPTGWAPNSFASWMQRSPRLHDRPFGFRKSILPFDEQSVDGFDFVKIEGKWVVSNAMWTVEPDACTELQPAETSNWRPEN